MAGHNVYPSPLESALRVTKAELKAIVSSDCKALNSSAKSQDVLHDLQSIITLNPVPVVAHSQYPFYFPGAASKWGISLKQRDLELAKSYINTLPGNHMFRTLQFDCGVDAIICVSPYLPYRSKL